MAHIIVLDSLVSGIARVPFTEPRLDELETRLGVRYPFPMVEKSETSVGAQVVIALVVLFVAWSLLKWVVKAVAAVLTTVVVLGLLFIAAWLFLGYQSRSSE